jgi:hypothetical protein
MGTGSFPRNKCPGSGVDHPTPSSAEVKERVQLYFYSPSGPSWSVFGWTLPLFPAFCVIIKLKIVFATSLQAHRSGINNNNNNMLTIIVVLQQLTVFNATNVDSTDALPSIWYYIISPLHNLLLSFSIKIFKRNLQYMTKTFKSLNLYNINGLNSFILHNELLNPHSVITVMKRIEYFVSS